MTEPERRHLRLLVDHAKRQQLPVIEAGHEQLELFLRGLDQPRCLQCHRRLPVGSRKGKKFCNQTHNANWHLTQRRRRRKEAA